jgi:C-terminal processing protease CtpA/Prc
MKNRLFVASLVGLALLCSCKKSDVSNGSPTTDTTAASAANALKDTTLSYTKDIYLWYSQIPSTFNAQSYADPSAIMTAIRQYSTEPGFSNPVDRWSFGMKKTDWDNTSSGVSADFGLNVFFLQEGDLRVKSVERSSPAGLAGIHRGWRITKINGSTDMTTSNANNIVNAVWYSSSTSFTFEKPDGSTADITLNAATYQEHPVILDSIYNINSKKIGYFAFNSFLGDTTEIYNEFSRVFNGFASANVNDVIVDLRYNGGGYVSVQQQLADWLAPMAANNDVMMNEKFNDKYTSDNTTDYFTKHGSLNLGRIFFIVSNSTASASELLINNLKPYMDVELIGPKKTYGKPVGFFPIPVGDWYIFPVSFRSTNKNNQGNYFDGLALNNQVPDGLDKDWGDVNESCLSSALQYITTGAFKIASQGTISTQTHPDITNGNSILDKPSFKGAIDTRRKK